MVYFKCNDLARFQKTITLNNGIYKFGETMMTPQKLHVRDLTMNKANELDLHGFQIRIYHREGDPPTANRVKVRNKNVEIEFLPSKGLSVAQAWIGGQSIFWEAPIGLTDTEDLDLWSDEIKINDQPAPGFTFLKTFCSGLELYGLKNWGMPVTINGKTEPLHGETSNIPVDEIEFGTDHEDKCWIQASFVYRTFEGDEQVPWYKRGDALFKVTRRFIIPGKGLEFMLEDSIENVSKMNQRPDWGYHITFRPEEGARLLVPSKLVQERGGGELPADIETWYSAEDAAVRSETGIIHQQLLASPSDSGPDAIVSLLKYPDRKGLAVSLPPSPYFQTWFCKGGKGSKEFTYTNGKSILMKNWDGMGLEIGSSALDHNGNTDHTVNHQAVLLPGESMTIPMKITSLEKQEAVDLAKTIRDYKNQ